MNGINEIVRALVEQTVGKGDADRASQQAAATADAVSAAMATVGAILPPDDSYGTGIVPENPIEDGEGEGSEEELDPPHPVGQVSEAESSTLATPLNEEITISQTLVSPLISSDNASVSVDITIDGNAEEYEVYWVNV